MEQGTLAASASEHLEIAHWDKDTCVANADQLAAFFTALWPEEPGGFVGFAARLGWREGLRAVVALTPDGAVAGCKLGYIREDGTLYSWLGGVAPEHRRKGLAQQLMAAQHQAARTAGLSHVTTSTRQPNAAMAIVNLQAGFVVCGFEQRPGKSAVVHWIKSLAEPAANGPAD